MERSMSLSSPENRDALITAGNMKQEELLTSAVVQEEESMAGLCRHTQSDLHEMKVDSERHPSALHVHVDVGASDRHVECPPLAVPTHVTMDVMDLHADGFPPPSLDHSSDTTLASPRSYLDLHQYPSSFLPFLQGSDPVKEELDRLQNEVREKNRELMEARAEVKALKTAERSREKALEELGDELARADEKLERAELLLENKNLELKRAIGEKKEAQSAQLAAEAIVRRVQAAHMREEELPPLEAIIAPLDAELKLACQEVGRLQDDNRMLDRMIKSKEAALLEAERTVQIATAKVSMVEDLQNKNQELVKHIELCQEESKVLDKLYRQKVTEVEKLSMRVSELEEALLASGQNEANVARDYQRQLQQLQEENRALERELAKAKILANRVSTVIANGWKGSNDKVMPVKHWLEERRLLQNEMEQLRQKLAQMEKAAKSEAVLKEKVQLRLKVLEESVVLSEPLARARSPACAGGATSSAPSRHGARVAAPQNTPKPRSSSRSRATGASATAGTCVGASNGPTSSRANEQDGIRKLFTRSNSAREKLLQRNVRSTGKSSGSATTPDFDTEGDAVKQVIDHRDSTTTTSSKSSASCFHAKDAVPVGEGADFVSGQLYDLLQKEVIALRRTCQQKDLELVEKDTAIEMLEKKVSSMNRSMESESKKIRREVATLEKEIATLRRPSGRAPSPCLPANKHKTKIPLKI